MVTTSSFCALWMSPSSHLLRNWWQLWVSSTVSGETFHPSSTIFLHGHIRDILQLWCCTLVGVCEYPPAPFSGETPPTLVQWWLAWKKWSRMTQAIGNQTEAMVTMVSAMIYTGQHFLYLRYHDDQHTSVIKIVSAVLRIRDESTR